MLMPTVYRYMTSTPIKVSPRDTMTTAHRIMRDHNIRHLVVADEDRLVGLLTDRDLHLLESLRYENPDEVTVAEALAGEPVVVAPSTPLDSAVELMSNERLDAMVVCEERRIVGIFTAVDALFALSDLLRRQAA